MKSFQIVPSEEEIESKISRIKEYISSKRGSSLQQNKPLGQEIWCEICYLNQFINVKTLSQKLNISEASIYFYRKKFKFQNLENKPSKNHKFLPIALDFLEKNNINTNIKENTSNEPTIEVLIELQNKARFSIKSQNTEVLQVLSSTLDTFFNKCLP